MVISEGMLCSARLEARSGLMAEGHVKYKRTDALSLWHQQ